MIRLTICFFLFLSTFTSHAQNPTTILDELNEAQHQRLKYYTTEDRDSVFAQFDKVLNEFFSTDISCSTDPDTSHYYILNNQLADIAVGKTLAYAFMNHVVITTSDNQNLKVYSIDELWGGPFHTYENYLQYKTENDDCVTIPIDTIEEDVSVGYYRIEELSVKKNMYYLLFGFGTYGSGKQHFTINIIKEAKGNLVPCNECFEDGDVLFIGANRSQKVDLKYDRKRNTISYKKYEMDNEVGFYQREFNLITLRFKKGSFVAE